MERETRKTIPEPLLDQLAMGELDPKDLPERTIDTESIEGRKRALEQERSDFLLRHPLRSQTKIQEQIVRSQKRKPMALWSLRIAMAALPALVLALVLGSTIRTDTERNQFPSPFSQDVTRTKGAEAQIFVYRVNPNGQEAQLLDDRDEVAAQDMLQIRYQSASQPYAAVFSIDGNGYTTFHSPIDPDAIALVEDRGLQDAPFSYVLDDAPDFESFFIVSSMEPFSLSDIVPYIEKSLPNLLSNSTFLDLPEQFTVDNLFLRKRRTN